MSERKKRNAHSPVRVVGVDPGKAGGIAWWDGDAMQASPMPATETDAIDLFDQVITVLGDGRLVCYIEQISAGTKNPKMAPSIAKLNRGYGFLRGVLMTYRVPLIDVSSGVWQRRFRLLGGGGGDVAKKNRHKAVAQQRFPDLKITHAVADAILICEYGRQEETV